MMIENQYDAKDVTITPIIFRNKCSVNNPSGGNGYCRNDKNGEWKCLCKFWWNGKTCNELSDGGKQVIALGVISAVLLAIFYGIVIFHCIKKRRQLPKTDQAQNIPPSNRQFPTIPVTVLDPSRRILSWITGIATLVIAASTLIVKWLTLKPIHEDIVDRFLNNKSVFFKPHSVCRIIDLRAEFNLFTFPVACLLILLFIITTKRVAFHQDKYCKGYFGIPIPIDFFGHVKRTLAAVIFAVFADELLDIATEILLGDTTSRGKGVIVTYLLQLLRVFVIGFRRFPVLAAVYINTSFSLICATLYVWLDFSVTIVYTSRCRNSFYITERQFYESTSNKTIIYLMYYGTGSKLLFFQLFNDIPRYVCLAYIGVKLPILLLKRIRQRRLADRQLTREQKDLLYSSLPHSAESRYVKKLLGIIRTTPSRNRCLRILRYIYAWRDDFRYSSRIVCLYASVFLLLFFLTVECCVHAPPRLHIIHEVLQQFANLFSVLANPPDPDVIYDQNVHPDFPIPDLVRPFVIAANIALVINVLQLLIMLASIRRNLLQAFRGKHYEIPSRDPSQNVSYIVGNFHFAGYVIGYVIIAYGFVLIIVLLLLIAIEAFILFGKVRFLETILKICIPLFLFGCFKLYLNKILGQHVFLQHHREVLSIDNRRTFMVFLYFNFVLDTFLGFIAALNRILKSVLGGILYMCRLDYSPLGRKLETMDAGFSAYCGLIHMECAHRHPVLLCFVSHLLRDHLYPSTSQRLSKAKHKWHLAIFLLNNPTLIYQRKEFLTRSQENQMKMMLIVRKNVKELYSENPSFTTHGTSSISPKQLEDTWEHRRF